MERYRRNRHKIAIFMVFVLVFGCMLWMLPQDVWSAQADTESASTEQTDQETQNEATEQEQQLILRHHQPC